MVQPESAIKFLTEVDNLFSEETSLGAILGPFPDPPVGDLHCSPIMTAPKDWTKCRIIIDLSFPSPQNCSVKASV
jgi:hypothetical protein